MFWKNAKSLSLVTKLMIAYSFSMIGLLSAIFLFLYPTFLKMIAEINGTEASHITAECYGRIIITLLVTSLSTIMLGYIIARKGLKRIQEFERKMEQITIHSLNDRINLNEWPKELKSVANKFNNMLDRIENSFNQLSQFSSDIAHELRTPLNNLMGITEINLAKDKAACEYRKILESCMDEYHNLSKLIENLLFLARSDHGKIHLNKKIINARDEILKICDYYEVSALENKIKIICLGNANVFADPILFKRIINNLISNALKYTKPEGIIKINIEAESQMTRISIIDKGVGISEEHISKLFDRFYRIDQSRTTHSGGLGLGLAIVKSIIDLHKGKIKIESKLNHGTSVCFHLSSNPYTV